MKVLLVLLTSLFAAAILLIAGVQLMRLLVNELTEIVLDAWRRSELPSSR